MKKFLFIITALFGLVFAQGVVTQLDNGSINYSDQSITAVGIGFVPTNAVNAGQARRMALRIAKQDAMRQLIEIVNGVTLTSETTMSGAMVDDVINTKVRGFIRGARPVGQPKYLSDTSVEMEYSVPMSGISDIILPPVTVPTPNQPGSDNASAAPGGDATQAGGVTGVIIDARGLKLDQLWLRRSWTKMVMLFTGLANIQENMLWKMELLVIRKHLKPHKKTSASLATLLL